MSWEKSKTETYANKGKEALKLDIYQPRNNTLSKRPVIVFMHGGGFSGGTPDNEAEVKFAENTTKKTMLSFKFLMI